MKPRRRRLDSMKHRIAALEKMIGEEIRRRISETRQQIVAELREEKRQ